MHSLKFVVSGLVGCLAMFTVAATGKSYHAILTTAHTQPISYVINREASAVLHLLAPYHFAQDSIDGRVGFLTTSQLGTDVHNL